MTVQTTWHHQEQPQKAPSGFDIAAKGSGWTNFEYEKIIAIGYNNIGEAYNGKGEYDKAISYYEKPLFIMQKFLPTKHQYIVTLKENLHSCLKRTSRWKW